MCLYVLGNRGEPANWAQCVGWQVRSWKSTLARLCFPILAILAIFAVGQYITYTNEHSRLNPSSRTIAKIPTCKGVDCVTLLYGPVNDDICAVMKDVALSNDLSFSHCGDTNRAMDVVAFDGPTDPASFNDYLKDYSHLNKTMLAVFFNQTQVTQGGDPISYDLWVNTTTVDEPSGTETVLDYRIEAQTQLNRAIMKHFLQLPSNFEYNVELRDYPQVSNEEDLITYDAIAVCFAVFIGLLLNLISPVAQLNNERSLKLREGMRLVGCWDSIYFAVHVLWEAVFSSTAAFLIVIVARLCDYDHFTKQDIPSTFLILFSFNAAIIGYGMLLSSIFRSSRSVNVVFFIYFAFASFFLLVFSYFWNICYLGYSFTNFFAKGLQWLCNGFPPFLYAKLYQDVESKTRPVFDSKTFSYTAGPGFTWRDLTQHPGGNDNVPTPLESIVVLWVLFVGYSVVSWYLDQIIPSEHSVAKPPWFFVLPSYYNITLGKRTRETNQFNSMLLSSVIPDTDEDIVQEYQHTMAMPTMKDGVEVEETPQRLLRILKLGKSYKKLWGSGQTALSDLTLSGEKGTCLCILGHNGAGKTTTIGMLTGLFQPSAGDALIEDLSILSDMPQLRRRFGVCPQHDILWDELTAAEHIVIFALMKGVPPGRIRQEIKDRLDEVGLYSVRHSRSATFSGGMKRRLSVAIAAIGNPLVIFMDEPTSGMDPASRRDVWTLFKELKKDRLIVLTTHSMEEADVLGDKIAILANGRMRAVGTPIHLKNRYGDGYHIHLVVDTVHSHALTTRVQQMLPNTQLVNNNAGNMTFVCNAGRVDEFAAFFRWLEKVSMPPGEENQSSDAASSSAQSNSEGKEKGDDDMVIKDWGLSQPTLEEVFLRITHGGGTANTSEHSVTAEKEAFLLIMMDDEEDDAEREGGKGGKGQILASIHLPAGASLRDLRHLMRVNYVPGTFPTEYTFLMHGGPLSMAQEKDIRASLLCPSAKIRKSGAQPPFVPKMSEMHEQLTSSRNQIAYLETEIAHLKARLAEIEDRSE